MAESLPGAAGAVNAIKSACNLIEIELSLLTPAIEDAFEIDLVAGTLGKLFCATEG